MKFLWCNFAGADYLNAGGTFPDGTTSVPSITFSDDTDTGIFRSGSGLVSIAANGVKVATFPTSAGSSGQVLSHKWQWCALIVDQSGVELSEEALTSCLWRMEQP